MNTKLSAWLRSQLQERNVKAYIVAANTGAGVATMSDILARIPPAARPRLLSWLRRARRRPPLTGTWRLL